MPHVDEGTLHALLDGALRAESPDEADRVESHLRACEDCRARYEHAAGLRDAAAGILGALDVDASPDFDEVLRRAGGSGAPGAESHDLARQARWTRRLAWAATIAVALGTGYLVGERFGGLGGFGPTDADPAARAATAEDAAGPESAEAGAPGAARSGAEDRTVASRAGAATEERRAAAGPPDREPPGPRPEETARAAAPDAAADRAGATRKAASPEPEPPVVAEAGAGVPADTGRAGILEEREVAAERAEPAGSVSALALEARVEQARMHELVADTGAAIALDELRVTGAAPEPAPAPDAPADTIEWRPVDLATARSAVGDSLYVLPKAEPVAFFVRSDTGDAVMTVQRLGSGTRVRVVQVRRVIPDLEGDTLRAAAARAADPGRDREAPAQDAPAAAAAAAPAPPDTARPGAADEAATESAAARAVVGGFTIEVSGPLPTELLQILAAAATPLPR